MQLWEGCTWTGERGRGHLPRINHDCQWGDRCYSQLILTSAFVWIRQRHPFLKLLYFHLLENILILKNRTLPSHLPEQFYKIQHSICTMHTIPPNMWVLLRSMPPAHAACCLWLSGQEKGGLQKLQHDVGPLKNWTLNYPTWEHLENNVILRIYQECWLMEKSWLEERFPGKLECSVLRSAPFSNF